MAGDRTMDKALGCTTTYYKITQNDGESIPRITSTEDMFSFALLALESNNMGAMNMYNSNDTGNVFIGDATFSLEM